MRTANRKRKGKAKTGYGVSAEVAAVDQKRTSQGRHEYRCTICTHAERYEIEQKIQRLPSSETTKIPTKRVSKKANDLSS